MIEKKAGEIKLELDKEYTYKEICEVLNWKVSTGHSKQAQIKQIESKYKFYHPINKKTHKEKKSYIFTEYRDNKYNNNHGGIREGAGRISHLDNEFLTILYYYINTNYNKNLYFYNGTCNEIYFNNDSICKFFGIYDQIYGLEEENFNEQIYEEICTMLRSRMQSIIFNKIKKLDGIELSKGIIIDTGKRKSNLIRHDEYLTFYDKYENDYLKDNKFLHTGQVIKANQWQNMISFIIEQFKKELREDMDFCDIKKYNKIIFNIENIDSSPTKDEYIFARKVINEYVVKSVHRSCERKVKKYKAKYNEEPELNELFGFNQPSIEQYDKIIDFCIKRKNDKIRIAS